MNGDSAQYMNMRSFYENRYSAPKNDGEGEKRSRSILLFKKASIAGSKNVPETTLSTSYMGVGARKTSQHFINTNQSIF